MGTSYISSHDSLSLSYSGGRSSNSPIKSRYRPGIGIKTGRQEMPALALIFQTPGPHGERNPVVRGSDVEARSCCRRYSSRLARR